MQVKNEFYRLRERGREGACLLIVIVLCAGSVSQSLAQETDSLGLLVQVLKGTEDPAIQASLLKGILSGLEGRRDVPAPKGWSEVSGKLLASKNSEVRKMALELGQVFGDPAAIKVMLATVRDRKAAVGERRASLRALLAQQNKEVFAELLALLDEPAMRLDAIRAYGVVEQPKAADLLLKRYPRLAAQEKRAVIETLATRKTYAQALLAAMKAKTVAKQEVPTYVARSLQAILGDSFTEVYGPVREVAQDKTQLIAKYKRLLTPAALAKANASRGRVVYKKTCAACHTLYDTGGKVGPNITGSNRANLNYILLNLLDPSYDVPESYKMVMITTVNGRVLSGVIGEENDQRLILKTAEQPRVVIPKDDIDLRRVSPLSLMPEGQLLKMKNQEVLDLIKYLQTDQQVELPK
jgi:putative heme-binding domain-containing protein